MVSSREMIPRRRRRNPSFKHDGCDGHAVDDPAVRDFARRWDGLGSQFHSNDATKAAARTMWRENIPELSTKLPWPADQLT
ncbi:MAG TPA: hypothetical protein VFE01_05960, partial [Terracidiphilus sp.]|nr:hypothetical protein [Terracidiphilus sp.]